MLTTLQTYACVASFLFSAAPSTRPAPEPDRTLPRVEVTTPVPPPGWALLERELLRANTAACRAFYDRYFDDRGWLLCVERWGGDDGPDDAIENLKDWPILHALGADDVILETYKDAWEGHLRQFTLAKTVEVPLARDGMYYKEFPTSFDWLHNGEGLSVFNLQGLSDSTDMRFRQRVKRFAGFYLNEDPQAQNYDFKNRIIKSMFNGSRGPLMRKATGLDWAGDPIEVAGRFKPGHGEQSYQQMLDHFKDYTDTVGDHPQNLQSTWLAVNAFMLDHEEKYRAWVLDYVGAWRERMMANGHIIPSNVGLDGKIGSSANGKWYGGVYGWGFTVIDPVNGRQAHRNRAMAGFSGFASAFLLTGEDRWLDPWRRQFDVINGQGKLVDGKMQYPRMHGDQGWYDFTPEKYAFNALELYLLSQRAEDRAHVPSSPWLDWLEGRNPEHPETALRADLSHIRTQSALVQADTSTPDTRLSDDSMRLNPCSVNSLIHLAMGGYPTGNTGSILHCRLRYFDADRRRAGLPEDTAALIDRMTGDETVVTLVNINQLETRTVIVQAGGYGEHSFESVAIGDAVKSIKGPHLSVTLAPGCGARLVLRTQRFVNQPTLHSPVE